MKYLFHIGCIFCVAALTGCIHELPVPPSSGKPRAVVYSELVAGKKVEMRVGKSKPVGPDINNFFEPVTNATAQLLSADSQLLEQLHYVKDTSSNMAFYRGNTRIESNKSYIIQVKVPDTKDVTAKTTIPLPIKVDLLDTVRTTLNGRPVLRFHFNVQPPPANARQFVVMEALKQLIQLDTIFIYRNVRYRVRNNRELYEQVKNNPDIKTYKDTVYLNSYLRIPVYTQDEDADNNQVGGLNENYNSILFTQRANKPLNTRLYINATALTAGSIEVEVPIGRVLVFVKSVTPEYYAFLLTYEKVRRNPGLNSLIQAIQIRSNAFGGLGVVGGCSQVAYYLYYDEL
ncbi:DUF4249 family protein [Chitinophaga oryzae]|uniref:DUF4249 family protein n=1 Tax=Chitinophaga oryzae TaxID=2725414 RepID=A0AAE7D7N4_9BACT|nr:DUF4249 family protein [Chitinophaga oryzae]QJB31187.1 DUF4249 family protein [Chitinophaga oryzae]QJB37674.1 DUF4249 family protein [Chitinophaga oryzae]